MLALLTAVPREAQLLRAELGSPRTLSVAGRPAWAGRLCGHEVVLVAAGAGKINAAMTATALLEHRRDTLLISCGCGGAYPGSGLALGDLALASEELLGDEGCLAPSGFLTLRQLDLPAVPHAPSPLHERFPASSALLAPARQRLAEFAAAAGLGWRCGPFVTVSTCTGTAAAAATLQARTEGVCENMEGAAVAQVAAWYQVPWLELRGISNQVEDRDLSRWDLALAMENAQRALLALLTVLPGSDPAR